MHATRRKWWLVAGVALAAGCDTIFAPACTDEARAAVSVQVLDSLTGQPAGRGARIVARDGAYADTAKFVDVLDGPYALAHEREGTYSVTVEQAGYAPWARTGVRVSRGECHVRTVPLVARLQRVRTVTPGL